MKINFVIYISITYYIQINKQAQFLEKFVDSL